MVRKPTTWKGFLVYCAILIASIVFLGIVTDKLILPAISEARATIVVPLVEGRTVQDAIVMLESRGLVVMPPHEQFSSEVKAGIVFQQMPYAGATVKGGRRIYLTVSKGVETATMPDLRGRTVREARLLLLRSNMQLGNITYTFNDSIQAETIMQQSIAAGTRVTSQMQPSVIVSQGPVTVLVPDIIGTTLQQAKQQIELAGLKVVAVRKMASSIFIPNTVLDTDPPVLSRVPPDSGVVITVSE